MDLVQNKGGIPSEPSIPYNPFDQNLKGVCQTKTFSSVQKTYRKSFYNMNDQDKIKR
jgi:cathepsin H